MGQSNQRSNQRLNPDALLDLINKESKQTQRGHLRVFLGMSAGVGKTYAMLKAAHVKQNEGVKVLIGVVETHGRSETHQLLNGLTLLPKKQMTYRQTQLEEFDIDAVLKLKPELVIIDELAHTNVPGSRHAKRYQDVLEILDAGINVYTALNVQHLESRKDSVEQITQVSIRETVPDSILEAADLVELVDIAPSELLKRLKDGKVYLGEKAQAAAENFFKEDKLTALREIALRMTAERVDQDLQKFAIIRDEMPWQTTERLLVAISHSPFSEKVIRATRRLAYNLDAPWIAVYVETGMILNEEDQIQLQKNLNLARELNAEVLTTEDVDIPSAIRRVARQKNVTQVIVGRPARHWLKNLLEGGSLLDQLVSNSPEFDIHIIRQNIDEIIKPSLRRELTAYKSDSLWVKYYYVLWFFALMTLISALAEPLIGYRAVGFLFLLAVILTSLWGSFGVVLLSATLSSLIWNFGFIPPRFTFVVSNADDMILLGSYFVVALITGYLTHRIQTREKLIREREERTNLMNLILSDITQSQNKSEFIDKVRDRISLYFLGKVTVILKSRSGELLFAKLQRSEALTEKEQAVAVWCFQNQKEAGWSTETLSEAQSLYLPLKGVGEMVGVLVYKPNLKTKKIELSKKEFLLSIVTQLGISIERHFLSRRLLETQRLKDSELLHQTLLNSISHELRTPLTTIMATVSNLEKNTTLSQDEKNLLVNLSQSSDRLNHVIENLLDMSRLNSGVLSLKLEWHDLDDLIGVVLSKLEKNLKNIQIKVRLDEKIKLVLIDFKLFEHAVSNLILNSILYAGPDLSIEIESKLVNDQFVQLSIIDNGVGISEENQTHLFEKFYRVPGSPSGGTGLGLSIVKGIIELHQGKIYYKNNLPHGSIFVIEIPYTQPPEISHES